MRTKKAATIIIFLYLVSMILVYPVFFVDAPLPGASWFQYVKEFTNLIPLTGFIAAVGNVVVTGGRLVYLRGYLLHLLCMVPVGMYYGATLEAVNWKTVKPLLIRYGVLLAVLYALRVGFRLGIFDVDDILLNLLGMYLGMVCWKLWKK